MLKVGDEAPNFTLMDTEMKPRSLKEFLVRGKVVLVFFPFAFSPICTKELCSYRDSLANFEAFNAQVIGVSVDSPFALKAFAEKNMLRFPLLSDFNREVSKRYGVLHDEVMGFKRGLQEVCLHNRRERYNTLQLDIRGPWKGAELRGDPESFRGPARRKRDLESSKSYHEMSLPRG